MTSFSSSAGKIEDTKAQDVYIGRASGVSKWLKLGAIFIVFGLVLFFAYQYLKGFVLADNFYERSKVRTALVVRGDYERSIAVQGNVIASFSPTLYAQDIGEIRLLVKEGDVVTKGQLLAQIDNPELLNKLNREQAALNLAQVERDTLRNQLQQKELEAEQTLVLLGINLEAERRELTRMSKIQNRSSISENDYEKIKDRVHALEVQVANGEQLNALEAENHRFEIKTKSLAIDQQDLLVSELTRQHELLSVRAPVDGVVGTIEVREQDTVARKQALMTVVDLSSYEVELLIPETYADSLQKNLEVRISYRGQELPGRLANISPQVKEGSVAARVVFQGEVASGLRENLRLNNKIILESKQQVLKVKRGPFVESHGGHGVYVMQSDDLAAYRRIEIGSVGINEVEILAGLKEGERLLISNTADMLGAETILITD